MPTARSIHIALNQLDSNRYAGWEGTLKGCERDAATMKEICDRCGFQSEILLNELATRSTVLSAIRLRAASLRRGDTLVITYSGHGSKMTDQNGDEEDGSDETWCLFDGMMIDDELRSIWSSAAAGARILLVSDSCHSGSIVWTTILSDRPPAARAGVRLMPPDLWRQVYLDNKPMYDAIAGGPPPPNSFACAVVQLSACRDNELAIETSAGGNFTRALRRVWNDGNYHGGYEAFVAAIGLQLEDQRPTFLTIGAADPPFVTGPIFRT